MLLIGNWKMNPQTSKDAHKLANAVDNSGAIICPPFVYLEEIAKVLKNAKLGAQDLYIKDSGAHTGEISPAQLRDLGVEYVLVGHSERRALGEDDVLVAKKLKAAHLAGLIPVLCVGESHNEREEGITNQVLKNQIGTALFKADKSKELVIAYEPVWAISGGDPNHQGARASDIKEQIEYIQKIASDLSDNFSIIYGGSSNASNIKSYISLTNVAGVLPGTASLNPEEFNKMLEIIKTKNKK